MEEDPLKSPANRQQATEVEERLNQHYPNAVSALDFSTAFELLVATVLSAQTTDKKVNQVTPRVFADYPDSVALAAANLEDLQELLRPLGMFRRRADQLIRLGRHLTESFDCQVPNTREELMTIPGVGRKTANVVLGNWFAAEEITVDTHVGRVARRLGWTEQKNPLLVEADLRELLPDAAWTKLSLQLILLGRDICHARKPACEECFLADICPKIIGR